ncbi:MAG TPA: hypothetical protein VNN77_19420 [candidate division Zixibacteria bacterium]|nr:hypothetical protein [candidate division Zixibacteria bacterium]
MALPAEVTDPLKRGSVYREFKELLRRTAGGPIRFYVGIRFAPSSFDTNRVEVATGGLGFEEIRLLKAMYVEIRDEFLRQNAAPRIEMAIEPLDQVSWQVSGIKHHGVLMIAEKGVSLRLPSLLSGGEIKAVYQSILASWTQQAVRLIADGGGAIDRTEVRLEKLGRIEITRSLEEQRGVVIGAPHGTYDEFTAETVRRIGHRTGLATVIAQGFTPTEAGGWRINVNRPTEKTFFTSEFELHSERARRVYEAYKAAVFEAARGPLALYIDVHQYGRDKKVQVATVGISREEARFVKQAYRAVRDAALVLDPAVERIPLVIEPIDPVEIGAWPAKAEGILGLAEKSLHFEVPGYGILFEPKSRELYTRIFSDLFALLARRFRSGDGPGG